MMSTCDCLDVDDREPKGVATNIQIADPGERSACISMIANTTDMSICQARLQRFDSAACHSRSVDVRFSGVSFLQRSTRSSFSGILFPAGGSFVFVGASTTEVSGWVVCRGQFGRVAIGSVIESRPTLRETHRRELPRQRGSNTVH